VVLEVVEGPIAGERAASLLRCAQELVRNAMTHAQATTVTVSLRLGDRVDLEVRDDGRWQPEGAGGQGLRNVTARAVDVGGGIERHSTDEGTNVRLWMPR
jgi:two-component system, NarL family, sensor histidine kinase DevS